MRKLCTHICGLICLLLTLFSWPTLVAPNSNHVALAQAVVTGPVWSFTGSLNTDRYGHTATLLRDGKVLVVGGGSFPTTAELYDPATGTWSYAGSVLRRTGHDAVLLPNGQVLVAGGLNYGDYFSVNNAELYDPTTERWRATTSLPTIKGSIAALLLPTGKVLAVGSPHLNASPVVWSAELYDPATEQWRSTEPPASLGTLTLLPSGKVLSVAGDAAELYDPVTERWRSTGKFNVILRAGTSTLLADGKVLVTGNDNSANTLLAELYDPATDTWTLTGSLNAIVHAGGIAMLHDGRVLLAGGTDPASFAQRHVEIYDPTSGLWTPTTSLRVARQGHTVTPMPNGTVLVTGGVDGDFDIGTTFHASAEFFDPGLPQAGSVTSVSAASFSLRGLASEAIGASFGTGLATTTLGASTLPLPTQLAGTSVRFIDSALTERLAPLFFVSPTQVTYQVPPGLAIGAATVTITSGDGAISSGIAIINAIAPSLFTANSNGDGVAAALALRVKIDGSQSYEPIAQFDAAQGKFIARPLDLGPEGEQVYLILFGTGIRQRRELSAAIATIGGAYADVSYAGAQGDLVGVDQVNVLVPRSLAGRGEVDVLLTVEAQMANAVRVNIK
ncbi:MAG: hypothetical protein ABI882_12685 [Acidobacteriota bacterium]